MNWSEHELECDRCVDAGAYVLGALDEPELAPYQEHLAGCAVCRQEVSQLQAVVDELPFMTPRVSAPKQLRDRLMATVHSEAELLRAAGSEADRPTRSPARWKLRSLPAFVTATGALAVGMLLGALAINGGSGSPASPTRVTSAAVASTAQGASAVLRQVGSRAQLEISNMPAPAHGRIYEIWLQRGSNNPPQPTDALFSVTKNGSGSVGIPGDLRGVSRVMVTDEPLGGSRVPTRAPTLVVQLA